MACLVCGVGGPPLVCSLVGGWGLFFIRGGRRCARLDILRSNRTARERENQHRQKQCDDAGCDTAKRNQCVFHCAEPPAELLSTRTVVLSTSESDGSTITASVGCRPE